MKAQTNQLQKMSQTLESSGFTPRQSNAVIESVALAMQTFAVTPEVLDQVLDNRLGRLKKEILAEVPSRAEFKQQGKDLRGAIKERDNDIKDLRAEVKEQGKDIKDLNKSMNHAFEQRDDTIKDLNKSVNHAFEKRDDDIKDVRGDIKDLNQSIIRLERTMMESNRKTRRYWLGFSLALLGTVATIVAAG